MRTGPWTAVAVLLGSLTMAATPSRADEQVKDGGQLTQIFAGNTAYITHRNGQKQTALLRADGSAKITQRSGYKEAKWRIEGDTICHDLSTAAKCYRVYRTAADSYRLQSTDMAWEPSYVMKAGNPESF